MTTDRQSQPPTRRTSRRQADLFERSQRPPSPLLTIGEVETLFCERLRLHRTTFFRSYRKHLPFRYTTLRPTGETTEDGLRVYEKGSPRMREDVALAVLQLAAEGFWASYAAGDFADDYPELYLPSEECAAPTRVVARAA